MFKAAAVVFMVGAIGGILLATLHIRKKDAPIPLAILHGLIAATGLSLLILGVARSASAGLAGVALGIYLVAALGGFVLFAVHLKKKPLPVPLIAIHALLAVTASTLLLISQIRG